MPELKTRTTEVAVEDFIAAIEHPQRRADALVLDQLFRRVTGYIPRLWGPSIIGYGRYAYAYESGHSGETCATGFSPRKANLVVYTHPGYADSDQLLSRLGKHKHGKSCLYINRLSDIDTAVLEQLVTAGLKDLATRWPIHPA